MKLHKGDRKSYSTIESREAQPRLLAEDLPVVVWFCDAICNSVHSSAVAQTAGIKDPGTCSSMTPVAEETDEKYNGHAGRKGQTAVHTSRQSPRTK